MKKNRKIAIIIPSILMTFFIASCNQASKEKEAYKTLMQEVLAVHDEVMPKMGKMNSLIDQLESKADTTELGLEYASAKKALEASNQYMMDWMKGFSENFSVTEEVKDSIAEKIKLLKEEEADVKKLRDQINSSIEKAEKLLGAN